MFVIDDKYQIKKNKMENFANGDLDPISSDNESENEFDNESDDEPDNECDNDESSD